LLNYNQYLYLYSAYTCIYSPMVPSPSVSYLSNFTYFFINPHKGHTSPPSCYTPILLPLSSDTHSFLVFLSNSLVIPSIISGICYEHKQYEVGLRLLSGVERQLIPRMGREGLVTQKCRRVERSTRIDINTRMELWTYLRQLNGQTLEKPRTDLEES